VSEDEAPGWEAINRALAPIYGESEPTFHYGTLISARLGGPDPIDGISAYRSSQFRDHWHFVTFGFSELYDKEWENQEISGWGFELTLRVVRGTEPEPPSWVLNFLQNLGRYVFKTGNTFSAGDHMNTNGPLNLGAPESLIRAFIIAADPQLPATMNTPHGSLSFVQVFGITLDELQAVKRWNGEKFAELASRSIPGLVTDLDRKSLLDDPAFARAAEEGIARDGSSTGVVFGSKVEFAVSRGFLRGKTLHLTLSATAARELIAILSARLEHDRDFTLAGDTKAIQFERGDRFAFSDKDDTLSITLTNALMRELVATVKPLRGEYAIDGMRVTVEPSHIRDQSGKIVETIG